MSTSDMPAVDGGGGGRSPTGAGGGGRDASASVDDAGDATDIRDVLPEECESFDAVSFVGEDTPPGELYNAITSPSDFAATRSELVWDGGCSTPQLRLTLSDGGCPDGDGHQLVFIFPEDSIASGLLATGLNIVTPEPAGNGLSVRYTRPARLTNDGEWGTCAGVAGTLDLLSIDTVADGAIEGRFFLELTRCDSGEASVQQVDGTFSATLQRGLEDVCPEDG